MTTRDQLLKLMDEHNLTDAHISILLGVSTYTAQAWIRGSRNMPNHMLELLQLKLAADTGK